MQVTKTRSKRNMLVRRHLLVAEEHDQVVQQGLVNALVRRIIQRRTQIHAMYFRADAGRQGPNLKLIVAHKAVHSLVDYAYIESMVPEYRAR